MLKRFRLQAVTAVGLLLLPLALPSGAAAQGSKEQPQSKQPAKEQEKLVRGDKDMVDGQIKTVTCNGRTLDMTFDDSYETLHLHTDNYFKVDFSAINFAPSGTMNPCKTAKGMYARVYYHHVKGHPKEGELISVEFRK